MPQPVERSKHKGPPGKKVIPELAPWYVRCKDGRNIRGYVDVDFGLLKNWMDPCTAETFLTALRRHAAKRRAATSTYQIRLVLRELRALKPDASDIARLTSDSAIEVFATLRQQHMLTSSKRGTTLLSAASNWNTFLGFVPYAIATGALPKIDTLNPRVRRIPEGLVAAARGDQKRISSAPALAPKSLALAEDSYNHNLFEPLSIGATEVEYLEEYTIRLRKAIDTIRSVAEGEFRALESKFNDRKRLMELAAPHLGDKDEVLKNLDSAWLEDPEKQELVIGLLLHFVYIKMDGMPQAWSKDRVYAGKRPDDVSLLDCEKLATFGKNRLLPYLGILTTESALICIILLVLEHPSLNSTTITRAEISVGNRSLFTSLTVGGKNVLRLTATKPRAGTERSVICSPFAMRVIKLVQEWTAKARKILISSGNFEASNRLWIGMSFRDYKIRSFSHAALTAGIKSTTRSYGKIPAAERIKPLVVRHPELRKWQDALNVKNIRVNVGVLAYLESGGDASRAAEVFGNSVQTALDDYIPRALRIAMFERQIRRHQNVLIAASFGADGPPLAATDFDTEEELHQFLEGALKTMPAGEDQPITNAISLLLGGPNAFLAAACTSKGAPTSDRLVLNSDPKYLCIAMLYRDHLRKATTDFLVSKEPGTGTTPKFWVDFVDLLISDLPNAQSKVRRVVHQALELKPTLRSIVEFPTAW
jgi:hypothetical protein